VSAARRHYCGLGLGMESRVKGAERIGAQRVLLLAVLGAGVAVLSSGAVAGLRTGRLAADYWLTYLPGAEAVVHGLSPYPRYTYPPQVALAYTPLTFINATVGAYVAVFVCAVLIAATLAVLRVRDPACYLAVFLWAPTWQELDMANITPALALGLALAWRYRDRPIVCGAALGLIVPAKLFLWPVLWWPVVSGRVRALWIALGVGLLLTFGAWALIDFKGLTRYPHMLSALDAEYGTHGYSFVAISSELGAGTGAGHLASCIVGAMLLFGALVFARRGNDLSSFTLCIAAALALTPIVWLHYLVLLVVPLAIARPNFSSIWLLPAVLWIAPTPMNPEGLASAEPLLVAAIIVYATLRPKTLIPVPTSGRAPAPAAT